MAMIKSLFYLFVLLFFVVAGLLFSFRNDAVVEVDLLFTSINSLSLGFFLLSSLIIGVVIGVLLVMPKRLWQDFKIKRLSKNLKESKVSSTQSKAESAKG